MRFDVGARVGPGSVLGEIGVFAPMNERMDTAVCETNVELGVISHDKVLQPYHQNPKFGIYMTGLVVRRLLENYEMARQLQRDGESSRFSGSRFERPRYRGTTGRSPPTA
jgi:CRP-like cAMP-binding protein